MLPQHEFILFILWTVWGPSLTVCAWFTDRYRCSPVSKALKFSFGKIMSKAFPVLLNPTCVCPWWLTSRAANLLKENTIMSKMKEWEKTECSKDVAWMELEKWGGNTEGGKKQKREKDSQDTLQMPVPLRQGEGAGRWGQRPASLGRGRRESAPQKGPGWRLMEAALSLTAPKHPMSQQLSRPIHDLESRHSWMAAFSLLGTSLKNRPVPLSPPHSLGGRIGLW